MKTQIEVLNSVLYEDTNRSFKFSALWRHKSKF